jgi:hypothetical protein
MTFLAKKRKSLEFANRSLYNVNGVGRICPLNLSFLSLSPLLAAC